MFNQDSPTPLLSCLEPSHPLGYCGKHPPPFTQLPYSCSLTEDVMTVVSAQVTVIHRVCSHQADNSYSFSFSSFSPVASFLGKFTGSKFLPISSSSYGSEVWGFQISRFIGSLIVVFEAKL